MGKIIFYTLIGFIGACIADSILFSPKAQIKELWKQIFKLSYKIGELRKKNPEFDPLSEWLYTEESNKHGKMINALLEYHFDPENDKEYIEENRYSEK